MTLKGWPSIGVFGAGAVGCYFGGMLARAGAPVTLIGRPQHVDAIRQNGLRLKTVSFDETVPMAASTVPRALEGADLVLFTVKTLDTESGAKIIASHLSPRTMVVSLQNGVDNVERMRSAGVDAVAAAIYVAVAMTGPGEVRHSGRGDLVVGNLPGQDHDLGTLSEVFGKARIPCSLSTNIAGELWKKLVINCAYNAISALTRSRYGDIVADPGTRDLVVQTVRETIDVGRASGVQIDAEDLTGPTLTLAREMMPQASSSTAQDIARGKKTEIDSLNGFVARRGDELGIPTPVNRTLWSLVKRLEASQARE